MRNDRKDVSAPKLPRRGMDPAIILPPRAKPPRHEQWIKLDSYVCVDTDDASFPAYFGFINDLGDWYILQMQEVGGARYYRVPFRGLGLYGTAWANRTTQMYLYWDSMI